MDFIGREDEVRRLRGRLEGVGPSLTLLVGPARSGRTTLLKHALDRTQAFWFQAAPLPDADQRILLAERIRRHLRSLEHPEEEVAELFRDDDWPALLQSLVRPFFRVLRPTIVVIEGWDRLVEGRRRLADALIEFWLSVRRRGGPFHLVLSSTPGSTLDPFREGEGPLARWLDEEIRLGPLPYRAVTDHLTDIGDPAERLRTISVFGGLPDVVRHLDPSRSLGENVRTAVLEQEAPLRRWGSDRLEREFQSVGRYGSILRALGGGALEWGAMRERLPDFESSGPMAPYIQRLEGLGLVEATRSLDSAPGSRRRRYRAVDPFTAFWFRFVLPNLTDLELGRGSEVWSRRIEPVLDAHAVTAFTGICREWLSRHADERLPAPADVVGGLWGSGYDLEVAGRLTDRALVYGMARWKGEPPGEGDARAMDRQIGRARTTPRGGGRHRLLFSSAAPSPGLRHLAENDPELHLIGLRELLGAEEEIRR